IRNSIGPTGRIRPMTVLRMVLPVVIGFGIFAIQFLPSQELANLSRRETITYQNSLDGSLSWGHLLTLVLPRLFGLTNGAADAKVPYWNGAYYLSWETAIYIGVLPLFFAIMAGLLARKKKYVPFFVGMALLAVTFALGDHFFVYRIFFALPLFDKFRTPARMMMLFSFAASALAGVGLSDALKSAGTKWGEGKGIAIRVLLVLPWLLALAGAWRATTFLTNAPDGADASIAWAASLATFPVLAMIVLTGLHYFGKLRGDILAFLVIAVTVIELFNYGMSVNAAPEDPRDAYREQPQLVTMLQNDQAKELSRARTRLGNQMILKRNQGAYDRIQLIEGYDPLVLQRVFPEMANPEASMDLMNLKWSITPGEHPGFAMRSGYLPRVKLYYQADILPDSQALAILKSDSTYDYRNRILLEEPLEFPLGAPDPAATARVTHYGDNEITAEVKTTSNAMLFFSEIYYPAWKAYVDGHPAKLYRAFTSLRAVEVGAGSYTVTLRYESSAFAAGSWITIVTLFLSLGVLTVLLVRERRSKPVTLEAQV
ncbi:MAG TPA: YfhO family protein, partial [Candidatus Kapabacteria bacterium]|nr:YfhO family protein [Candidatus Kapabacteria bacterium]